VRATSIDDLVQLPEALALQKHFDAKNFSRLRWLLLLVAAMALVGLAVAAAARVSALRVAFYVVNLAAVLGFIAVYREQFFERHFRQILVAYFFVQMSLPELWTVRSGADWSLQMGGLFPLVLMAFRLRLLEHLVLYGAFWVAEALHWGPGGLQATGGAAAETMTGSGAVIGTQQLEIVIAAVTATCLIIAGATTYLTMAYIVFVNPVILANAGMDQGAVFVATCLASALATLLMALFANYPLALAPGMGMNAYFAYTVVKGLHYSWQVALGAVFISGVLFLILSLTRVRSWIVDAIPLSQKLAISAGIGLFLGIIALKEAGIVAASDPSLHSFAPNGPSGSMLSTMMGSTSGDSTDDGLRYSSNPGFISMPSFQIISSVSACPMPIQTEPII